MTNEELIYLYQQGNKQALDKLIEKNTGIVYKIANKFYVEGSNSIDKEDLEQEGFMGLMVAAEKYDFNNEKKALFISYAVFWIYSKINRFIKQKNTNEETSLNTPRGEDGSMEIVDYIEGVDYGFENVEEKIYIQQLHEELNQVMMKYNTLKEREIIKMHYGWDGCSSMNFQEIGDIFSYSRTKAYQLESTALGKIRRSSWGAVKVKELYAQKIDKSKYRVPWAIKETNFPEMYLCEKII